MDDGTLKEHYKPKHKSSATKNPKRHRGHQLSIIHKMPTLTKTKS